ncbi:MULTISPECIES: hypothetical protein [unclassified Synechococcus]
MAISSKLYSRQLKAETYRTAVSLRSRSAGVATRSAAPRFQQGHHQ